MAYCVRCRGSVVYVSCGGAVGDLLTWRCKDCGYVDTAAMRRTRRIRRRLLAVAVAVVSVPSVIYLLVRAIRATLQVLGPEQLRVLASGGSAIAVFVGLIWSWSQLGKGGLRSLMKDLRFDPNLPRRDKPDV